MTPDDIKAAIQAEGGVVVGNWTYAATKEIVNQFQKYVKDTYGVDIKLTYAGTQAPSEYITKLSAAKQGRQPGSLRRRSRSRRTTGTTRPSSDFRTTTCRPA